MPPQGEENLMMAIGDRQEEEQLVMNTERMIVFFVVVAFIDNLTV